MDEAGEAAQDEEEVRLEREALEVISARAAEYVTCLTVKHIVHSKSNASYSDMIDVLHTDLLPAETTDTHRLQQAEVAYEEEPETEDNDAEDVEQAWLQSLPVNELDQDVAVKGSYAGNLVIDLSALRDQGAGLSRRAL